MLIVHNIVLDVTHICANCVAITLKTMLYRFSVTCRFKSHCLQLRQVSESLHSLLCCRLCMCILLEEFTCCLGSLHKIILAHHHHNCQYDSGSCALCGDLESFSTSTCLWLTNVMPTFFLLPWAFHSYW